MKSYVIQFHHLVNPTHKKDAISLDDGPTEELWSLKIIIYDMRIGISSFGKLK